MNTPQQEADKLIEKYIPYMYCYMGSGMLSNDYDVRVATENAKQCAIIHVEGIIEVLKGISIAESGSVQIDYGHTYYEQILDILKSK